MIRNQLLHRYVKFVLAFVLLCLFAYRAEAEWQDDYEAGVKAAESQNWAVAEAKLQSALAHQPKQGKKVRVYGTRFIRYLPSYYLGVIYMSTGREKQGLEQFSIIESNNILSSSDPEYARMQGMIQSAIAKNGAPQKPTGPTPEDLEAKRKKAEQEEQERIAQQKVAEEKRIADQKLAQQQKQAEQQKQIDQQKRRDFDALLTESNEQLTLRNYDKARRLASQAAAMGLDSQKTASLLASIDVAEKQSNDLRAKQTGKQDFDRYIAAAKQALGEQNFAKAKSFADAAKTTGIDDSQAASLLEEIERRQKTSIAQNTKSEQPQKQEMKSVNQPDSQRSKLEQDAMLAFYSGNYSQSTAILERLIAQKPSAKLYFYLGCNNAALALLAGKQQGAPQLQKARQTFAQAHKMDPSLQPDQKYISPRILQLFRESI